MQTNKHQGQQIGNYSRKVQIHKHMTEKNDSKKWINKRFEFIFIKVI